MVFDNSYKHKTAFFGTDAELYVSRLFMMMRNPNGTRRPDLISFPDNDFDPRLSIEVKSSKYNKGIMVEYQLHYAITPFRDYEEGKDLPFDISDFKAKEDGKIAYYYDLIHRVDGLTAMDVDSPTHSIKCMWGDQYLVPNQFAFYAFAVSRVMRSIEKRNFKEKDKELLEVKVKAERSSKIKGVITGLEEVMNQDAFSPEQNDYEERRKQSDQWQNIFVNDIRAIFHKNSELASRRGKQRIELLYENYPKLAHLESISIPGPNDTNIYVLADPEHHNLFDKQLREVVMDRIPVLNKISEERKNAALRFSKVEISEGPDLFSNNGHKKIARSPTPDEEDKFDQEEVDLMRLKQWLDKNESHLGEEKIPF